MQRIGWFELLGSYLKTVREKKGYSLRFVAARTGISAQFLSLVERGENMPSDEVLENLASFYIEDLDKLKIMAGRISDDILSVMVRPNVLVLLRGLARKSDAEIVQLLNDVQDGNW